MQRCTQFWDGEVKIPSMTFFFCNARIISLCFPQWRTSNPSHWVFQSIPCRRMSFPLMMRLCVFATSFSHYDLIRTYHNRPISSSIDRHASHPRSPQSSHDDAPVRADLRRNHCIGTTSLSLSLSACLSLRQTSQLVSRTRVDCTK